LDLYNKGYISGEDALAYASNPSDLELKMKGISSSEDYGSGFFNGV
jgi:twitching motility protein PilT